MLSPSGAIAAMGVTSGNSIYRRRDWRSVPTCFNATIALDLAFRALATLLVGMGITITGRC